MATPEQAIAQLAFTTGISQSRVWTTARILREAGDDLWPAGARGRAKPRHVGPHHLGNLAIACGLAAQETMATTPDRVRAFRMLVQIEGSGTRPGLPFGEALDELIDLAARDITFRGQVWASQGPVLQLAPTKIAHAEISGGPGRGLYRAADVDGLRVAQLMHVRSLSIINITLIDGVIIKTLAELWADSQAALESESGTSPPVSPPTGDRHHDAEETQAVSRRPGTDRKIRGKP
jgi:hypothetical protein